MSDIAIRVENLSKQYGLGVIGSGTLSHDLNRWWARVRGKPDPLLKIGEIDRSNGKAQSSSLDPQHSDYIWALRDVSFDVKQGEVLGIIGRNGAGKSTLLKILSRVTAPTSGVVKIKGRIASLLEVGTGFHPELTGRENIYLNGAILGMNRKEIARKFDEIVAFAEIDQFIDTPVKRYSSGMYVRLAFAVAAHLEPEILMVDEVLAVGDVAFQKKCLGKMSDVAKEGRTVLFVSHNLSAVEGLCSRAMLIDSGHTIESGQTHQVVSSYLGKHYQSNSNPFADSYHRGNGKVRVVGFRLEDALGNTVEVAQSGVPTMFVFEFQNRGCSSRDRVSCGFSVHTDREVGLCHYYSHFSGVYFQDLPQTGCFKCLLPRLPLAPGNYLVMCRIVMNGDQIHGEEADWPQVYVPITVTGGDFYNTGNTNLSTWGPILIMGNWQLQSHGLGNS